MGVSMVGHQSTYTKLENGGWPYSHKCSTASEFWFACASFTESLVEHIARVVPIDFTKCTENVSECAATEFYGINMDEVVTSCTQLNI